MGSSLVVQGDGGADRLFTLARDSRAFGIGLFIFNCSPQSFHKDIVPPISFAIHADPDIGILNLASEGFIGEQATLIGIGDLRRAISNDGFIYSSQAEVDIHNFGRLLVKDFPAIPVDNGGKVDKPSGQVISVVYALLERPIYSSFWRPG